MDLMKTNSIFDEFNKSLGSFWNTPFFNTGLDKVNLPPTNVKETDNDFQLELAIPGAKKEDIKLEIKNGNLVVSSENKTESEENKDDYTRKEYSYSSFYRAFALPENADENNVNAKYEDGILKIVLQKNNKPIETSRQIEIG